MKRNLMLLGIILIILAGVLPACGGSEPETPEILSEEITWSLGETTVYATVTYPGNGKNLPAVVFVPGSGPTDRDWNSPLLPGTNGSAALLAEELAGKGYVTIRYDKRFAGTHAAENTPLLTGKISMLSHFEELQGVIEILVERTDVDKNRIFVLANSEGVIHTINYQKQTSANKLAGMILAGAPGQPIGELARTQIEAQLAGFPGADEIMKKYDEAIEGFLADGTMNPDDSLPDGIKMFLQSLVNPANMPFTQELWMADIAPDLKNINVPVLIIIGKKDIQVNCEFDGGKLQAAAEGKKNITFSFPENANHVLKYEPKSREEINLIAPNYNGPDTVLDMETLDIILAWLAANS